MTDNEKFGLQCLKCTCSATLDNEFRCAFRFDNGNLVEVVIDHVEEEIAVTLWRGGKKIAQILTRDVKMAKHLCGYYAKKESEK